jgi:hypothetical protein
MRFHKLGLSSALVAVTMAQAPAQTRVDLRTQAKNVDFSGANSTKPSKTGTALPATCSVGESFFKTDAQPGLNQYACTAANVWTVQGLTQGAVTSVFGRTGAVTAQSGDYSAAQVTNAVDKTAANTYGAGARQTFVPSTSSSGLRLTPAALPGSPQTGDLAVDVNDGNHPKVFDGTSWVGMTTVPNYSATFTAATRVTVPGTVHKLGTANLLVEVYDNRTPAWHVEPDYILIDPTTNDVTVDFQAPQSGRVVINAGGGGGTGGSPVAYLTATATLDFAGIAFSGCSELTFALPGAATGDGIAAGWPSGLEAGLVGMMRVSAADTVAVRLCNLSGAALNPTAATFRATIVRSF